MTKPTVFIVGNLYRVQEVSRRRGEIQEVHSRTDGRSPTLTRDYQRTPQFQCHNHPILSESKYGKCSKIEFRSVAKKAETNSSDPDQTASSEKQSDQVLSCLLF